MATIHEKLEFKQEERKTYAAFTFKPVGIDAKDLAAKLNCDGASVTTVGDCISICVEHSWRFALDFQDHQTVGDLMSNCGVDQTVGFEFSTTASCNELLTSDETMIDLLAKGLKMDIDINLWKEMWKCQLSLLGDGNMAYIMITLLFATTPIWMFWATGEIAVDLDKRAVELLKQRPSA